MDQPEEAMSEIEQQFEKELTRMMRRVDPPAGFAERTIARSAASASAQVPAKIVVMKRRPRAWFSGAIAAALVVGIFFTEQSHLRREHDRAAQAQSQFEAGMRITDHAIEHTRQQLQRAGLRIAD